MFSVQIYLPLFIVAVGIVHSKLYIKRTTVPKHWIKSSEKSPLNHTITFYLACKQDEKSLQKLESIFWQITDPDSDQYQQWLTRREINSILKPHSKGYSTIQKWCKKSFNCMLDEVKIIGTDTFQITTTIEHASKLFSTQFYTYTHVSNVKRKIYRTWGQCDLPDEIHLYVDLIVGLTDFPIEKAVKVKSSQIFAAGADFQSFSNTHPPYDLIVPQFIIDYYNIPNIAKTGLPRNVSQGVVEFSGQYYDEHDLQLYSETLNIPYKPLAPEHIIGTNDPTHPGIEAQFDIEQVSSINPLADNWFINYDPNGDSYLYTTTMNLNQLDDLPQVLSISYGGDELGGVCNQTIDCRTFNTSSDREVIFIQRTNIEFMKLSMRGISILIASGDVGANTGINCTDKIFSPIYPATCPYITSVGGTELINIEYNHLNETPPACSFITPPVQCISNGEEVAVDYGNTGYTSSGGFSRLIPQPIYQQRAVQQYFGSIKCNDSIQRYPSSSMYNSSNRGFPDVAAFGTSGYLFYNNSYGALFGTSMSAPIWAGIASILNSYALERTNKTLGFLNPLLYKMAHEEPNVFLNDIIVGDNKCSWVSIGGICTNQCQGFQAGRGWDPVTGLGSPNVGKMLQFIDRFLEKKIAQNKRKKTMKQNDYRQEYH
ncbi:unnamed protein product [Didymodactylos carnosus]|uniref:Tripeptidyl-peptidase 1 n=1 Tax=Didymodactylos carnosus TaxID=1234261 RepID=A0A815C2A5_9BILA|nr:unnamed protein product [Didymodactylos carnosus]CAF1278225.1 unnamed protein product [Didymodactylos carnosus]CAF3803739.1 unnamed protein product [Didymodactylos carnosus]CAF4071647.1 unnamed protein product [Didymodactylos carnosus]